MAVMSEERPRRPGRPPLVNGQRGVPAMTTLPAYVFDELCAIASREGVDLAVVIRYGAERLLDEDRKMPIRL